MYQTIVKYKSICESDIDEILDFVNSVYQFINEHPELELENYKSILHDNGIEWDYESMAKYDVTHASDKCILALIVGMIRADRFSEGVLERSIYEGLMSKWIDRLNELDESND